MLSMPAWCRMSDEQRPGGPRPDDRDPGAQRVAHARQHGPNSQVTWTIDDKVVYMTRALTAADGHTFDAYEVHPDGATVPRSS